MIERLRKEDRRWRRTRWVLLAMAGLLLAAYAYIAHMLLTDFSSDSIGNNASLWLFALFWPKILLASCVAGGLIGLAIRDWHGNVTRMLLLRLLDAQHKPTVGDEHAA